MTDLLAALEKSLAYETKIKLQAELIERQRNEMELLRSEIALLLSRVRIMELRLHRRLEQEAGLPSLLREQA